jgi:hypothetical protein
MAYYISLKSLRSLEEFWKNPHVKIPPKSSSTNFQSLGKFKNPILIQKFFFLAFGPANLAARSASGPAHPPAAPSPQAETIPAGPSSPRVSRVFVGIRFPFWFVPSRAGCLSLVSLSSGPRFSAVSSPPCRPTPATFSRRLRPPRAARPPTSRCPARYLHHALIPLLNHTP